MNQQCVHLYMMWVQQAPAGPLRGMVVCCLPMQQCLQQGHK